MISPAEFQTQTSKQPRKLENFRILPETKAFLVATKAENNFESEGKALDYLLHTYPLLQQANPVSKPESDTRIQELMLKLEATKAELESAKAKIRELEQQNHLLNEATHVMLTLTTILEPVRNDAETLFEKVLFKGKPAARLSHIDVAELLSDYAYRNPNETFPNPEKANAIYERAPKKVNHEQEEK
jgi:hypothetical protein